MEEILRTERDTRKFRLLALLSVVAGAYLEQKVVPMAPAVVLTLSYLAYLSAMLFALIRHVPERWLPYVMLIIDTAFASGTLYFFGLQSAFFVLFPMLIIYYAIYFGYASSFASATLIAVAYAGLAYSQQVEPAQGLIPVQFLLFYIIALFSGYIADQRRKARRERQELAVVLQAERGARAALELAGGFATMFEIDDLAAKMANLFAQATACSAASTTLIAGTAVSLEGSVITTLPPRDGYAKSALATIGPLERQALVTGDIVEILDPAPGDLPQWAVTLSPAYLVAMPLLDNGRVLGTLCACDSTSHQPLDPSRRVLAGDLARFFVPLIANAKAYAGASRESARLSSELRGTVQQVVRTQLQQKKPELRVGRLVIDPALQHVVYGALRLDLTAREFDVLYCLAQHAGQPLGQEVLLRDVWGDDGQRRNVVDVAITRLRRKLAAQAGAGDLIQTVRGVGYVLDSRRAATEPEAPAAKSAAVSPVAKGQTGVMLLEHVIALAIVAIVVPALLAALVAVINHSTNYNDRTVIMDLATSQMESIQKEGYQANPSSYSLISAPTGYTVTVTGSTPITYTYYGGSASQEILQAITVTVNGINGALTMQSYKYRR